MAGGGAFTGGGILARASSGGMGAGVVSAGQHPSVAAAASLMSSHLQAGQYHKVGVALLPSESAGAEGIMPKTISWSTGVCWACDIVWLYVDISVAPRSNWFVMFAQPLATDQCRDCIVKVREVFEELVASGLAPTLAIWNTLLAGLAAQGAWLDALSALQQVHNTNFRLHPQNPMQSVITLN